MKKIDLELALGCKFIQDKDLFTAKRRCYGEKQVTLKNNTLKHGRDSFSSPRMG